MDCTDHIKPTWHSSGPHRSCNRIDNGPYGPYSSCNQVNNESHGPYKIVTRSIIARTVYMGAVTGSDMDRIVYTIYSELLIICHGSAWVSI